MPVTGGCLCGAVRYTVAHAPERVFFCYCRQCQKAQGTPFVASVPVAAEDFKVTHGADVLKAFRASPSKARYFCGECGSPIFSQVDDHTTVRIRAGSFDEPPALTLQAHIYVGGRPKWYAITDRCPQYPASEPGR